MPKTIDETAQLDAVRAGDSDAFWPVWEKYEPMAARYAASRAPWADAEDVAGAALEAVLKATRSGGGPTRSVKSYILTAVRSEIAHRAMGRRAEVSTDSDVLDVVDQSPGTGPSPHSASRELFAEIVSGLDEVDRYLVFESVLGQARPRHVAEDLAQSPTWVSRRLRRIKADIREAWVQAHINTRGVASECADVLASAGRVLAGRAAPRPARAFWTHVEGCPTCETRVVEAQDSSHELAIWLPGLSMPGATAAFVRHGAFTASKTGRRAGAAVLVTTRAAVAAFVAVAATGAGAVGVEALGARLGTSSVSPARPNAAANGREPLAKDDRSSGRAGAAAGGRSAPRASAEVPGAFPTRPVRRPPARGGTSSPAPTESSVVKRDPKGSVGQPPTSVPTGSPATTSADPTPTTQTPSVSPSQSSSPTPTPSPTTQTMRPVPTITPI